MNIWSSGAGTTAGLTPPPWRMSRRALRGISGTWTEYDERLGKNGWGVCYCVGFTTVRGSNKYTTFWAGKSVSHEGKCDDVDLVCPDAEDFEEYMMSDDKSKP